LGERNAIAQNSANPYLETLSGKEKGNYYEVAGDRLSIGRSDNNDVVVQSEAVSRYHAVIEKLSDGRIGIRDHGSKNGIQINGETVRESELLDGDTVQIGNSIFRFHNPSESAPTAAPDIAYDDNLEYGQVPGLSTKSAGPRSKRPLIYGAVGLLLAYLYLMDDPKGKKKDGAKSGTDVAATEDFKTAPQPEFKAPEPDSKLQGIKDPTLTRVEQEVDGLDWSNNSVKESEQYFRRGQRDYTNKNYHRAIEAFSTALSLNRTHELADYYLRLTLYEVEVEAKKNMEIGRKYFESMQYARAMYHFNEVVSLMQHRPTEKIISDAEKYIQQCKRRLQAAEQFP